MGTVFDEVSALGEGYNVRLFNEFGSMIIGCFRSDAKLPKEYANLKVRSIFVSYEFPTVVNVFVYGYRGF